MHEDSRRFCRRICRSGDVRVRRFERIGQFAGIIGGGAHQPDDDRGGDQCRRGQVGGGQSAAEKSAAEKSAADKAAADKAAADQAAAEQAAAAQAAAEQSAAEQAAAEQSAAQQSAAEQSAAQQSAAEQAAADQAAIFSQYVREWIRHTSNLTINADHTGDMMMGSGCCNSIAFPMSYSVNSDGTLSGIVTGDSTYTGTSFNDTIIPVGYEFTMSIGQSEPNSMSATSGPILLVSNPFAGQPGVTESQSVWCGDFYDVRCGA